MENEEKGLQKVEEKSTMLMTNKGIAIKSFDDLWRFSKAISTSGLTPKGMEKPESIMIAIQMGLEIGLSPMKSLQSIAVINGKPSIYGDAAKAMCLASPVCEYINEYYEGDGETLTAICESKRVNGKEHKSTFSVSDAKKAGLWNKNNVWSAYGKRMLMMRARGFELRDNFTDVLGGFQTYEEVADYQDVKAGEPIEAKVMAVENSVKTAVAAIAKKATPAEKAPIAIKAKEAPAPPVEVKEIQFSVVAEEEATDITEAEEIKDPYSMEELEKLSLDELKEFCVDMEIDYTTYEGKNTQKKLRTLIWEVHNKMPLSISLLSEVGPETEAQDEPAEELTGGFSAPPLEANGMRSFPNMKLLYNHMDERGLSSDSIMAAIDKLGYSYSSKEDMARRGSVSDIDNVLKSC